MIPWQIYCDLLEDKGIDCRLLRTLEPSKFTVSVFKGYPKVYSWDYCYGCGWNMGWYDGDGKGGFMSSDSYNGDGSQFVFVSISNNIVDYADKQTMVQ